MKVLGLARGDCLDRVDQRTVRHDHVFASIIVEMIESSRRSRNALHVVHPSCIRAIETLTNARRTVDRAADHSRFRVDRVRVDDADAVKMIESTIAPLVALVALVFLLIAFVYVIVQTMRSRRLRSRSEMIEMTRRRR